MKKMILTLAIAISSIAAFADTAIGRPVATNGVEDVNKKAVEAFKTEFTTAKEVEWTTAKDYYKASFVFNEKHVFAFYSLDGDFLGITRYISPVDLPLSLQISLKKISSDYWISDLFEMAKNGTTSYYITIENAETKAILRSTAGSDWEEYKTVKKS